MPAGQLRPGAARLLLGRRGPRPEPPRVSAELAAWLEREDQHTLGSLVTLFGERAFAVLFIVLLSVPAIPAPTGGVTHVFEVIAVLLALELIAGRRAVWLPARWGAIRVDAKGGFAATLLRIIRGLERVSKPRLRLLFGHRLSGIVFGLLVAVGSIAAFLAPPFSGLDTLPALGVVVLALGVLLEDAAPALLGVALIALGIAVELAVGAAVLEAVESLF